MKEIFRQKKAICPRCKSWEYCRFRYMNNKGWAKKMQPRYMCYRCQKHFTLGGKLYNTSLHSSSTDPTPLLKIVACPHNCIIASPPNWMSSCDPKVNGCRTILHAHASSNICCCTVMGGACQRAHGQVCCEMKAGLTRLQSYGTHFCGYPERNGMCSCASFLNSCNNIMKEGTCYGTQGKWAQHDEGLSVQWAQQHPNYDSRPTVEVVLAFTIYDLQNSQQADAMAPGNKGINICPNNIPLFNNTEPLKPFGVFHETDFDIDFLSVESLAKNTTNGISVSAGGEEVQLEEIAKRRNNLCDAVKDTQLHPELENLLPLETYNLEEENEWLNDIFQGQGVRNVNGLCGTKFADHLEAWIGSIRGLSRRLYQYRWHTKSVDVLIMHNAVTQ